MNRSIYVAVAGWCVVLVQAVLSYCEISTAVLDILWVIETLIFILAIILGIEELIYFRKVAVCKEEVNG